VASLVRVRPRGASRSQHIPHDPANVTAMTDRPLPDTWAGRDFPVLTEVARRLEAGERAVTVDDLTQSLALSQTQAKRALEVPRDRGLIVPGKLGPGPVAYAQGLAGDAYFLTGLHPSGDDAVAALFDALGQAVDRVDDAEQKSRLRALLDSALDVSRDVLSGVLTAVITHRING
jgi:hypothetical protein